MISPSLTALPESWKAPGMGLKAGKREAGRGWGPTLSGLRDSPPPQAFRLLRLPGRSAPSPSHTPFLSLLTPYSVLFLTFSFPSSDTPTTHTGPRSPAFGLRTQAHQSHLLSPEVTEDQKWKEQVLGHGTFESAGGTEMSEGLLPATALSLPRQPVTPDGPRTSPTLPGWSPSLAI